MVVGFFPIISGEERDKDGSLGAAVEHFRMAMTDVANCLRQAAIPVAVLQAKRLIVENGPQREELPLGAVSNEAIGCYFVAPNRSAKIVRATAGPSSLTVLCPAAAATYFDVPGCCPHGFRCCADGRILDEPYRCDG
jgi:hypothetical protein